MRLTTTYGRCKMSDSIVHEAFTITSRFLLQAYGKADLSLLYSELRSITGAPGPDGEDTPLGVATYEEVQKSLSTLNEKETIQKSKGVYYTPSDVVRFILVNSMKSAYGKLTPDNLHDMDLSALPYRPLCTDKTVFDPTCGAGEFLLAALELKLDLLDTHCPNAARAAIHKVVSTIRGNDINRDSVTITKIRLLLCVLHRYGPARLRGLSAVLNGCFSSYDFIQKMPDAQRYDIIVGNPPYVEDWKSDPAPERRYGNIYGNVLENAALHLNEKGALGFIIPLSYVATPRMQPLRDTLFGMVEEQYILSYSDRPDCLFLYVHQKLCILFGKKKHRQKAIYTGSYQYWYNAEREDLFRSASAVRNRLSSGQYIPKVGSKADISIYQKVTGKGRPIIDLLKGDGPPVYLNMRATFWIKAFTTAHNGAEYKEFGCRDEDTASYCMCLLNSSIFWWYWVCVSDCWHITLKELGGFTVPRGADYALLHVLASRLEVRLEETKKYVGTKQTEYEYKHKDCVGDIHRIDDYINALFGLSAEESRYIKQFAYRYRIGRGAPGAAEPCPSIPHRPEPENTPPREHKHENHPIPR